MFVQVLICLCIPLGWGLLEPLADPQVVGLLQQMAHSMNSIEHLLQNLTSEITSMKKKQDAIVYFNGFYVRLSGSTLMFSDIDSNIGNAYNQTSGVFHAPLAGMYTFTLQITASGSGSSTFAIIKQGSEEISLKNDPSATPVTKSVTITIHVKKGDDVLIREIYNNNPHRNIWGRPLTQFSGYLLRAD